MARRRGRKGQAFAETSPDSSRTRYVRRSLSNRISAVCVVGELELLPANFSNRNGANRTIFSGRHSSREKGRETFRLPLINEHAMASPMLALRERYSSTSLQKSPLPCCSPRGPHLGRNVCIKPCVIITGCSYLH